MVTPEDFGRSVNPILTRGQVTPTTLLLASPDFPTFLRPCLPHTPYQNKDKLLCDIDLHVECSSGAFYCYYLLRLRFRQKDMKAWISVMTIVAKPQNLKKKGLLPKSLYRNRTGRHFYGTENEIWAGFRPVGNTEKKIGGWLWATFEGVFFMF